MRISDWSSDVCSSDLAAWGVQFHPEFGTVHMRGYVRARAEALARDGFAPQRIAADVAAAPHARRVLRRFVPHARCRQALSERLQPRTLTPPPPKAGEGRGGASKGTARKQGITPVRLSVTYHLWNICLHPHAKTETPA